MTAIDAIRAWLRLDAAFAAVNADLARRFGITGAQLGMLRILDELGGRAGLADLRAQLVMHPATLGQLLARLADRGLVTLTTDPVDRRRRTVTVTAEGDEVLRTAPMVGPVRLRRLPPDDVTCDIVTAGLTAALDAFGLRDYSTGRTP